MSEQQKPPGLSEAVVKRFLDEFANHLNAHGKKAIDKIYEEKTVDYLRLAMALFPKHMQTGQSMIEAMSDGELVEMLERVRSEIADKSGLSSSDAT
jgi:hypothetical protein